MGLKSAIAATRARRLREGGRSQRMRRAYRSVPHTTKAVWVALAVTLYSVVMFANSTATPISLGAGVVVVGLFHLHLTTPRLLGRIVAIWLSALIMVTLYRSAMPVDDARPFIAVGVVTVVIVSVFTRISPAAVSASVAATVFLAFLLLGNTMSATAVGVVSMAASPMVAWMMSTSRSRSRRWDTSGCLHSDGTLINPVKVPEGATPAGTSTRVTAWKARRTLHVEATTLNPDTDHARHQMHAHAMRVAHEVNWPRMFPVKIVLRSDASPEDDVDSTAGIVRRRVWGCHSGGIIHPISTC